MPSEPPTAPPPIPTETDTATAPDAAGPSGPTAKTWILGGIGAVVIAAAAIIGINAASSDSSTVDTTATGNGVAANGATNGAPTGPGGFGQGGFGQGQGRGGAFGTIASIDGSTIEITDRDGTSTTVETTDATTVTKSVEAKQSDLKVGDHVRVVGTGTSTAVAAERVTDTGDVAQATGAPPVGGEAPAGGPRADGAPGAPAGADVGDRAFATGVIASIDGSKMVVTATDGTSVDVTLSDTTTYSTTSAIEVADLAKGDTVMVRGETTDGKVTATAISEGELGFGGRGGFGGGGAPAGAPGGSGAPGAGAPGGSGQASGATGSGLGSN